MTPVALLLVVTWLGIALLGFGFAFDDLANCRADEAARQADPRAKADRRKQIVSERAILGARLRLAILVVFILMGLVGVASLVMDPVPPPARVTQSQAIRGWSQVVALYAIEVMTVLAVLVNWRARHKFPAPEPKKGG